MTFKDTISNVVLKLRYKYFKNCIKPVDFGTALFEANFDTDKFTPHHGEYYWDIMVTSDKNVEVKDGILNLYAKPYNKEYTDWSGLTKFIQWTIGYIDYHALIEKTWGTWSATMKFPKDTWPAFWLLRRRHWSEDTIRSYYVKNYNTNFNKDNPIILSTPIKDINYNWFILENKEFIAFVSDFDKDLNIITPDRECHIHGNNISIGPDHIIPEVDIMEPMKKDGKDGTIIKHTLHYGYRIDEYNGRSGGPWIVPADDEWHIYSATLSPTGYKFYIDNLLTGVFTDPLSIVDIPAYPILNIAVHPNRKQEELTLQVKDLKYYE